MGYKMKIGTLTFPGSPSHGASLQMYALYSAIKNMNIDVSVINYISPTFNYKKTIKKDLKTRIINLILKDTETSFKEFESKIKVFPQVPITTTDNLREYTSSFDRIIVGSDQVWNPIVTGNDMNFYLEFCNDNRKKASYAPSFGVNEIAKKDKEKISNLLSQFSYLSTREERGKELIYELIGKEAPIVLDPTFLIKKEDWRKLKKPSGARGDYVFFYTIKPSEKLEKSAKEFAKKHHCKYIYISGGLHGVLDKFNPNKHPVFGVGPAEFLDLIDNAKYVFTNSFHGAALSIILNKNFYVEFSSDTNSRLITLIKSFELNDHIINCDNFKYDFKHIDYVKINNILDEKRKESLLYLKGIICENE